ncbi:snaclec 27-like [Lytechinus pictus]|uniref:snaclec 27-like n=1 Tax=Lytechinus pictus TaxID=7653 RepID=UPI00240E31C9|nr:snaclec 27-like [Lytechinus pictus]
MLRIMCLAALALAVTACPVGWHQSGRSCYKVSQVFATYNDAVRRCAQFSSCETGFGGHLVSITTDFENQQVLDILNYNQMARNETWLGLRTFNGPVFWASGEPLNPRLTNPWHAGNPVRGPNMCTVAFQNRWATRNCNMRRQFICEMGGEAPPPAFLVNQETP